VQRRIPQLMRRRSGGRAGPQNGELSEPKPPVEPEEPPPETEPTALAFGVGALFG